MNRVSSLEYKLILSDKTFRPIFSQEVEPRFHAVGHESADTIVSRWSRPSAALKALGKRPPIVIVASNYHFAVPTIDEQRDVVAFLRTSIDKLGAAAFRTERETSLIDEYRTRLIADVVTGKVDVREAAARLKEVDLLAAEDDADDGSSREAESEGTGWRHGVEEGGSLAGVSDAERSEDAAEELMTEGR